MSADPRVHLSQVLDLAESVIEGARPDQATLPTPCRSWDVQTLVAHLITDTERSAVAASGGTPDWTAPVPEVEGDWASAFHAGAAELKAAWQHAGDMNEELELRIGRVPRSFVVRQQISEFAVHSWDLATATGQRVVFPAEACEAALVWARTALRPEFRGDEASGMAFGPEVEVPDDAPAEDRLAAFFGRNPGSG
jgi:uncharacterized protein (TIGR03086 family)